MQKTRKIRKKSNGGKASDQNPQNRAFRAKKSKNRAPNRARGTKSHTQISKPRTPNGKKQSESKPIRENSGITGDNGGSWIWGRHAVQAALDNDNRHIHEILATRSGQDKLSTAARPNLSVRNVSPQDLDHTLPTGATHQGIAARVGRLGAAHLDEIAKPAQGLILVLDQITDPHNVGAMFRLASAFGAKGVIMQSRNAPPLFGATAKVAVGSIERVPHVLVTNIANTLITLKDAGWRVTGLAGETDQSLSQALNHAQAEVIVMGAEGPGLRKRVRETCDQLARIPMPGTQIYGAESLNVATAAAIALYEASRDLPAPKL